jgi:hypothetical protein
LPNRVRKLPKQELVRPLHHGRRNMANHFRRSLQCLLVCGVSFVALSLPAVADAQEREYVAVDEPSAYPVEFEPHFTFGAENVYGQAGFGAGLRVSIPVVGSLLRRIPDNLAISFGGDIVHYDNCYYADNCGANYLMLPVAAQWNIFLARRVSVFVEGGVFVYKGFFDGCAPVNGPGCVAPPDFGVLPTLAVGGRIHLGDNVSLIARIGYPTVTFGVSFL